MARAAKRKRRRKLDAPEPIEDLLDRAGEDRFAKRRAPIPMRDWKAAVGPRIADRAHPVQIDRGVLLVKVATSVWANELSMLAPEIVARLRVRGYAVESLRFRVGVLDTPDRPPERRVYRKVPPPKPLAPELQANIAAVEDDELRAAIAKAASANLAWQEYITEAPRGARGPRAAGRGTAPPARSAEDSPAASRRNPGGDSGRRR